MIKKIFNCKAKNKLKSLQEKYNKNIGIIKNKLIIFKNKTKLKFQKNLKKISQKIKRALIVLKK